MESLGVIHFTVNKVMNVVGIGYIITGQSSDGKIKPGATVMLGDDSQHPFVIDAIEQIEYAEDNTAETALILEDVESEATELLMTILPGKILTINSPF